MKTMYSFIIPHHNCPSGLHRLLDSIPLRNDIQIIIVDDNSSPDKKPKISRSDTEVIFLNETNSKWAGHARNVGLEKAIGEWILFADADDFYNDGFLDVLDLYAKKDLDIVYFNANSVDSATLKQAHRTDSLNKYIQDYMSTGNSLDEIKFKFRNPWHKMVRKSLIDKYHIFFEEIQKGNDMQYSYLTGYFAEKYAVEPRPLYTYTYSSTSMSFSKRGLDSYLCSIENIYKSRTFYTYIGHPNWEGTVIHIFNECYKREGLKKLLQLITLSTCNIGRFIKSRHKYVHLIESRKA